MREKDDCLNEILFFCVLDYVKDHPSLLMLSFGSSSMSIGLTVKGH